MLQTEKSKTALEKADAMKVAINASSRNKKQHEENILTFQEL
jgi:hypothetical protein